MSTPEECGAGRWCDEPNGHTGPHRHVAEITLNPPQDAHHVTVTVVGATRIPYLEVAVGTARSRYATATLDWGQVEQLASVLAGARQRYA